MQQQTCTRTCFHIPSCRLLLAVLILFLCFLTSCHGQQKKVASWEMDVLQTFYDSTGGKAWNYASMEKSIQLNFNPGFIGRKWNFTKSVQGSYLYDPCPTLTSPPFMGVNCSCVAASAACNISAIVVPGGNFAVSTIPAALGQLTHLTILGLPSNSFYGRIPTELGDLTKLQILHLYGNRLSSSIPASLGKLRQLQILYLYGNQLTSSIPPSLGDLTQLTALALSTNKLASSIPTSLGNLTKLYALYLSGNQLASSIPSSMGKLAQLNTLDLSGNRLSSSIPVSLGDLTQLTYLALYGNKLASSIPTSLGNLTKLNALYLHGNQLASSIPTSLGKLTQLEILFLFGNRLTSSIPASLGNLTKLQILYLFGNQLNSSIPTSLGKLTQLNSLSLSGNRLTSSIPASLGNLTKLQFLYLFGNQLNSSIPASLGKLRQLTSLSLSSNRLTSSIPTSLGDLTKLQILYMNLNELSSSIPTSLGKLTQLSSFSLSSNRLTSSIPASLGNLTKLQILYLATNQLSSSIQTSLGKLAKLNALDLSGNRLSSSIPAWLGDLTQLTSLSLSTNKLTSSIPTSLGNLTKLNGLYLYGNQLSSSIPAWLGDLKQLTSLDLSTNKLTSSIPTSLGKLTKLNSLTLSGNQLSSSIPTSLGDLTQLTSLSLSTNKLNSSIQTSLGKLTKLNALYLSSNQLSSSIPAWLGDLKQLNTLDLSSNRLSSSIPTSLGNLTKLTALNLYRNELTSSIPTSLGKLAQLTSLSLSSNRLTSSIPAWLGDLTQLTSLALSNNKLTSSIQTSLGKLTKLNFLDLSGNRLSSSIPAWLGDLTQLTHLALPANQLTSSIPTSLGNLTKLNALYLKVNQLSSSIPTSLGKLTQLEILSLDGNRLTSSIPAWLGDLTQLTALNLDTNKLTSSIPTSLGKLTKLNSLSLSGNRLSSSIPDSFRNLVRLRSLVLSRNQLTSSIPASLGQLTQLNTLMLQVNRLTSSIPASLGNLLLLRILYLDRNQFHSFIPAELGNLVNLCDFGLSYSSLVGVIPSSFGRLTQLTHLDLSSNALSGMVPHELANLVNLNALLLKDNHLGAVGSSDESAFGFINPAKQTKLTVLDMSSNAFEGSLSESIFALPSLEVFAAGSNCFSGELPSNLCAATKMKTLAMTGLSSGASCRKLYWKDTVFSRVFGFDGFGADHAMQGSLPQCVYGLPRLRDLLAAGNSFQGQVPSLESGVSTSLQQIDVSRNRLTGSITKEIAAAMLTGTGEHLQTLNMSYNRIGGDLSAFAIADSNSSSGMSFNASSAISLEVNRLSGAIPQSLRSLQQINILAGNVFECSADRTELPEHDIPAIESYQCDSKPMNIMIYAFAAFVVVLLVMWEMLYRKTALRFHFRTMRTWLLTVDGIGAASNEFAIAEITRYSRSMGELRQFVVVVGLALLIVLIVYGALSGGQYRTLEHSYLWVTTASYLMGRTSAVWLLTIGVGMVTLTCYLVTKNVRLAKAADVVRPEGYADPSTAKVWSNGDDSRWARFRMCVLPTLRLFVLIAIVWGAIAASNVWYLDVLLHGTPQQQEAFKLAFAVFKLVWTSIVTPKAFRSKLLLFGLEEERHNAFLDAWLGGEVQVMLAFNAISTFGIPLLVAMVDKVNCFRTVFTGAAPVSVQFEYESCVAYFVDGTCGLRGLKPIVAELQVPFTYNYTCSSSMISAYVPLYQQMLITLIAISCMQLVYLCVDISDSERSGGEGGGGAAADQKKENAGCLARIRGLIKTAVQSTLPTSHLMLNSSQRSAGCMDGVVFVTGSRLWITKRIPAQFSNLLILVTFGVWAPLLGATAVLAIVLDTYVAQLVIGRFLVVELGVVQERKEELGLIAPYSAEINAELSFTPARRKNMLQDIQDCDEPWGAVAVLKEVEEQCAHWPASILSQGRTVLVAIPAIAMAFLILDVINSDDTGDAGPTYWPCIFLVCYACALEFLARVYKRYRIDRSRQGKPKVPLDSDVIGKGVDVGSIAMTDMSKSTNALSAMSQSEPQRRQQSSPPVPPVTTAPSDGIPTELDLGDTDFIPPATFDGEAVSPMHTLDYDITKL